MSGERRRADAEQRAERVNAAAALASEDLLAVDAARRLAAMFGISVRQARRYVEQASQTGPVPVPAATTAFTIKLPVTLVDAVRRHAAGSGRTISAVVAQALTEFLARHRHGPRRPR
jgi:hypothetical protein